ncbi:MAG: gliding motility-associated C-terminal domain-containing protein [Bacteroidales bacterium]|nr:gliding motility-associated C-terminal domain-containing protein [Bacteroidales bacterium]
MQRLLHTRYFKAILLVIIFVFVYIIPAQNQIIMPQTGDTTILISSSNTYTVLDPGGDSYYPENCNSTITIRSTDGRPFSIYGNFSIDEGNYLTVYQGGSTKYPIERFCIGNGSMKVYCYSGEVTLKFYSDYFGIADGFSFNICFPTIYDVHVFNTNTTYTHFSWQGGYSNGYVDYFQSHDPNRSTTSRTAHHRNDSLTTLAQGTEYTYYIKPSYSSDTSNYCVAPPLKFRTPKVYNCSTCNHYRECIKYTQFSGAEQVTCYKGTVRHSDSLQCVVDLGWQSDSSQHTVNTDPTALDERTGNQLHLVPTDDTVSVRLGNPRSGGGESILYEIHVDTNDYNLMMLRYAMVFQQQIGVLDYMKPRFTIRLFDENCLPVQPLCYCRDFMYSDGATGWNTYTLGNNTNPYHWHDWMSMGIDLSPYHGKTLYLQLSTTDGSSSSSAYAYFTLHCARKQIDHQQQCGNNTANTFYAPEGFNYRWYNAANPDSTLSVNRMLNVVDSGLYQCYVTPTDCDDPNCGYIINALAAPRFPHADFSDTFSVTNCQFRVRFTNESKIYGSDGNPLWTNEDCETAFWDFGNGQTSTNYNAEVTYTAIGTYQVTLIVGIAGNECKDTITKSIVLTGEYPTPYISGDSTLCPGQNTILYIHNNNETPLWTYQNNSTTRNNLPIRNIQHSDTVFCHVTDSNHCTYDLAYPITVFQQYDLHYARSICQAQLPWTWRGETFYSGTTSNSYLFDRETIHGCDSIVHLDLTVLPSYEEYKTIRYCDYLDTYAYADSNFTSLGEHTYTFHLNTGCDSIIHLNLLQRAADRDTFHANICRGDTYNDHGFSMTSSETQTLGNYSITHRTPNSPCDSFATLVFNIYPQTDTSIYRVINQNQLPWYFNGVWFDHSVIDTVFHLTNHYGCDSTIHYTLYINMNTETHFSETICDDQLPFQWGPLTFLQQGTQNILYQRSNGADSTVYYTLNVNPTYNNQHYDTICDNQTFQFEGNNYTNTGTYSRSMTSNYGCDSTETLHLTVHSTNATTLSVTTCISSPYSFAGQTLTTSGTYTHTFANIWECDSVVTLNLVVNPVTDTTIHETILENDLPHTFNGQTFTSNVLSTDIHLTNHYGCDSTIHYSLTINWNDNTVVDSTICDNLLPLTWDGTIFSASDFNFPQGVFDCTKTDHLYNTSGADSVVVRNMHINPTWNQDFYMTICDNSSYTFAGTSYNTTGEYTHHLMTTKGCDSTVTLHLTVNAVTHSTVYDTILENELSTYQFNGHSFNGNVQNETITITNIAGCDSVINFSLYIYPNVSTAVDSTICQSALPLTWNGKTFTSAGTQSARLYTATGADSIVTMTLHVNPTYDHTVPDTICDNQTTTFIGNIYSTAGSYPHALTTINGCDSIVTLLLTVNPTHISQFLDTTCDNQTYTFGNIVRNATGDYTHTFQNIYSCDSVVTLHLTVNVVTNSTIHDTIVENQLPFTFNGMQFTDEVTNTTVTISNAKNCDSVITYSLFVWRNQEVHVDSTLCENFTPLTWNGKVFTQTSTDSAILINMHGADSTVWMHFTRLGNTSSLLYDTIVENQLPHSWNGITFTWNDTSAVNIREADLFHGTTLTNHLGCDSLTGMNLHVWRNRTAQADSTLCENYFPLVWNSISFDTTGTQIASLSTTHGADSTLTMNVNQLHNTTSVYFDTIVENQLPFTFNNTIFDISDFILPTGRTSQLAQNITIANEAGCDSIIAYSLFVHWNVSASADSTICDNLLPFTWNGALFDSSLTTQNSQFTITRTVTLTAHTGADSVLTMNLHVNPTYDFHFYDTICSNQSSLFNDSTYTLAGTYPHLMTSINNCDSLETLHLTVFGTSAADIADTIVENQLPYSFNGATFDTILFTPATYLTSRFASIDSTIVIVNSFGCDSSINYTLNVHWNVEASADSTICENFLPLQWNSRTFTMQGTLLDTLTAYTGADSVLTMNLTVDTNTHSIYFDTIVENNLPHTFNGESYIISMFATTGGQHTESDLVDTIIIPNVKGCDSIIFYNLHVNWNITTNLDSTICENSLPLIWNGISFDTSNFNSLIGEHPSPVTVTDTAVFPAALGQDSLVVMHLTVHFNTSSILFDTIVENMLPHPWNGVTFDTVPPSQFTIHDTYFSISRSNTIPNAAGCDSIAAMNLHVWRNVSASADSNVCENFFPFSWNGLTFDTTGTQTTMLQTTHGADSLLTMNVTMLFNTTSAWTDTIVENQLPFTFNGYIFTAGNFADTASYSADSSVYRPHFSSLDSVVIIPNVHGCDSIISYSLYVHWNVHVSYDSTVCYNLLPLTWNNAIFDTILNSRLTITRIATLPAYTTADSIITMNLHVNPTYANHWGDTVCDGQSLVFYGDTLTVTGLYEQHFLTVDGCDSSEYLHFENFPNFDLTYYDTICDYSGVMRIGVEYLGISHMNSIHGCDSNETYHLWGFPVSYTSIDTIISDHQLPFIYSGYTFVDTANAQMQMTLVNRYGCDSIVNFTLTVMPTVRLTVDSTICSSQLPITWDNTPFDTIHNFQTTIHLTRIDTLHTRFGADSIVTRNLHVNPDYNIVYVDTTCNGAPYPFGDSLYTTTGTYIHNYTTIHNCDSVETLHLQVNALSYATQHDTIVENQLPYTFGGVTFDTSIFTIHDSQFTITHIDTVITILNTVACDSVITYSLTLLPNAHSQSDTSICYNQLPLIWDGLNFDASMFTNQNSQFTLNKTIPLPDGTDSIAVHTLTVHPVYDITDTVVSCDSINWIDGNTYTQSNHNSLLTLHTVHGCDSVINLNLTIHHSLSVVDSLFACDSLTWIDGITYTQSNHDAQFTLNTIHNCDSLVNLNLTVAQSKTTQIFDTLCKGIEYHFGGNIYTESGSYVDSLFTTDHCDSVVTLNLHILLPYPTVIAVVDTNCDSRTFTLTAQTDAPYFQWGSFPEDPALTGHLYDRTIQVRPTTHELYRLFADYADVPTCPSTDSVYLSPLLKPHADIEYTPEFLTLDQLHLSAINRSTNELTHHWYVNGNDLGANSRISYFADPAVDDSVVVRLIAQNGLCYDSAVVVVPFRKATIWAPNVFTPTENSNNTFYVRFIGITDYSIDLYTRGGVLVWHSEDMYDEWDGTYKGSVCPQGTYVWIIHYRDQTAPRNQLSKKGTVTLIR